MSNISNVTSHCSAKLMFCKYNNVYPPTKIPALSNRNFFIRSMKMPNGETSDRTTQGLNFGTNEKTRGANIEPCNSTKLPVNGLYSNENLSPTLHKIEHSLNIIPPESTTESSTLGRYLAQRLVQIGINDVFGVPGDSNLSLLDQMILEPRLNLVGCCNELNAGYAADGYARSRGVGACVFTFTVGGLSAINAIAGAYSENIPVICIVGGPNSNYYSKNVTLHHTIGLKDFSQELRCFQHVTCYQAMINNLEDAQEQIDTAIKVALCESKPVYIHISSNLASIPYPSLSSDPIPLFFPPRISNPVSLEAAVEEAARLLNKATKPVLVGGAKLRSARAKESFVELADACCYGLAVMPAAKGLVPENHPQFMETYWGPAGSPCCAKVVESADMYLYVGPVFDDISSLGFTTIFEKDKMIVVYPERVTIGNEFIFGDIFMNDFLQALSKKIRRNNASYENYRLLTSVPKILPLPPRKNEALKVEVMFKHIQELLSDDSVVIADTGDSWFRTQKLKLPQGCRYEVQMHYASIGWSIGATLGYAQAAPHRKVVTCIGDGSFQMTAQEVSTMLRCGHRSIIFLINNGGYSTEIPISDGPYNEIKNWDYAKVVSAIDNHEEKCWVAKVQCEEELICAIETAMGEKEDKLCFIEVIVGKHDTSTDLVKLGTRLAQANSSLPTSPR